MIRIGNRIVAGSADVDLSTVLKSLNKTGLSVWVGTQTEHDALAESVKNNDKTTFITYDTDEDVYLIIDTIVSYGKTWSSVKISSELAKKINASDVYTKEQVDEIINAKLASALKYKGAVNTTALLPGSAENGDTYFVKADGFMYAYNSTSSAWDALGTVADMTNYFTKTEITALLQDKADKFQYDVMPTPSSETVGVLLQYTGADTEDYKNGYFYTGIDNGDDTYAWELAKIGKYEEIIDDTNPTSTVTTLSAKTITDSLADKVNKTKNGIDYNDMNDILEVGSFYFRAQQIENAPADAYEDEEKLDAVLEVVLLSETNNAYVQTLRVAKGGKMYVYTRRIFDGRWSAWQELATTDVLKNLVGKELRAIEKMPTETSESFYISVTKEFTVDGVTIPVYAKGVFSALSDGFAILIDADGYVYHLFRNVQNWICRTNRNEWVQLSSVFSIELRQAFQESWNATETYDLCYGASGAGTEASWFIQKKPDISDAYGFISSGTCNYQLRHKGGGWEIKKIE